MPAPTRSHVGMIVRRQKLICEVETAIMIVIIVFLIIDQPEGGPGVAELWGGLFVVGVAGFYVVRAKPDSHGYARVFKRGSERLWLLVYCLATVTCVLSMVNGLCAVPAVVNIVIIGATAVACLVALVQTFPELLPPRFKKE